MELLDSPVRAYAWGSHTAIAQVQGRPTPTPGPEAELWMGDHPAASSVVVSSGRTLAEQISTDAERLLGAAVVQRSGPHLPFLLKLLAADQPLSIQAHPDEATARAGYEAEEAAGIPRDDPKRNYKDPHHKPELLYAVSDFHAICGWREPAATSALLARIDAPRLAEVTTELIERDGLRRVVTRLLTMADHERLALVAEVVSACAAEDAPECAVVVGLSERYPGDVGAVLSLLMNTVRLSPGQAMYLPAGVPHAYLRGLGVEIMASSDNVLRGGLTRKWVDVAELLRVLRFDAGPVAPLQPVDEAPGVRSWRPPVADFALTRVTLDAAVQHVELPVGGPRVLFCLAGSVAGLPAGRSAFAPVDEAVELTGRGTVFVAGAGGHGDR